MTNLKRFPIPIDFEMFRPELNKALAYSDAEYPVGRTDRIPDQRPSFLHAFPWSGTSDRVPDAKTVWLYQKRLTQAGAIDVLFNRFDAILWNAGYLPMSGQILDATLVATPK